MVVWKKLLHILSLINPGTAVPVYYRTLYASRIKDILHRDMLIDFLRVSRARFLAFLVDRGRTDPEARFPSIQITFQESRNVRHKKWGRKLAQVSPHHWRQRYDKFKTVKRVCSHDNLLGFDMSIVISAFNWQIDSRKKLGFGWSSNAITKKCLERTHQFEQGTNPRVSIRPGIRVYSGYQLRKICSVSCNVTCWASSVEVAMRRE